MRCVVTGGRLWGGSLCFLPPLGFFVSFWAKPKRKVKNVLRYGEVLMRVKAIYSNGFSQFDGKLVYASAGLINPVVTIIAGRNSSASSKPRTDNTFSFYALALAFAPYQRI
jgi:hypothetical protein